MIFQGGMGVAVSDWRLARAVSTEGQLGVVSGTGIDSVLVRRLQDGDLGGHMRRALASFPFADVASRALETYFRPEGRAPGQPYARLPLPTVKGSTFARGMTMLAAFSEVFLAKEGHDQPVGLNLLTKVQVPNLATLYGAMLAGVDAVLMGAGIPREEPGALDRLAAQRPASLSVDVAGSAGAGPAPTVAFDPAEFGGEAIGPLRRPAFLPIISSHALAKMLLKRATGAVQGFVVEGPTAGGHNAPPRGKAALDETGQPVYGERDVPDLAALQAMGLPFWLAGGTGSPEGLRRALDDGAAGIQVGTLFAYSDESGLEADLKRRVIARALAGQLEVRTDPRASPTGFPFKAVSLPGTNAEVEPYERRTRVCDLGYLREPYRTPAGTIQYRCAAEPVDAYVAKGGRVEDTVGRKCLCNALMADVGLPQVQRDGQTERPLVTSGDALSSLPRFLRHGAADYTAGDVVRFLLGRSDARAGGSPA